MKISIITPALNSEKYIGGNLKSVHLMQQGDFEVEQIIVDGGSIDNTLDIVEKFKKRHQVDIKIIRGKDKNMYDAINKGLEIMKGDIWACLNTDDQYNEKIFSIVVKEFNKHPEIDVVYGYLDMVDETGKFKYTWYLPKLNMELFVSKGYENFLYILHPSTFLRKKVVDTVGYFDIAYKYAADYDYLINIADKCNIQLIHKSFTRFRRHPNSASSSDDLTLKRIFRKEGEGISKKYMAKFNFTWEKILFDILIYRLVQIRPKNLKYLLQNNRIYLLWKNRIAKMVS